MLRIKEASLARINFLLQEQLFSGRDATFCSIASSLRVCMLSTRKDAAIFCLATSAFCGSHLPDFINDNNPVTNDVQDLTKLATEPRRPDKFEFESLNSHLLEFDKLAAKLACSGNKNELELRELIRVANSLLEEVRPWALKKTFLDLRTAINNLRIIEDRIPEEGLNDARIAINRAMANAFPSGPPSAPAHTELSIKQALFLTDRVIESFRKMADSKQDPNSCELFETHKIRFLEAIVFIFPLEYWGENRAIFLKTSLRIDENFKPQLCKLEETKEKLAALLNSLKGEGLLK